MLNEISEPKLTTYLSPFIFKAAIYHVPYKFHDHIEDKIGTDWFMLADKLCEHKRL